MPPAFYFDANAGLQAVLPGRHDLFASGQAIINNCNAVADPADFKGPSLRLLVGLNHISVVAVWPALERSRWHRHHVRLSPRQQPNVEKLARPQCAMLVGESPLETHRPRSLRDLVVENRQGALGQLPVVVAAHREDVHRTRFQRRLDGSELTLRQSEDDRDRLELRDNDEARRIGGMHDVALIDQSDAGPAGDRGGNRRVVELGLCAIDRRLIALNLRIELRYHGALRIDLLYRGKVARRQIAEALQVEFCVGEIGLILHLFGDRLIIRGLKGTRIDLR